VYIFCSVVLHRNVTIVYAGMVSKNVREKQKMLKKSMKNDTEKSAKLVIDYVANKSVYYVSVGTYF
jgi:hypothetical protein